MLHGGDGRLSVPPSLAVSLDAPDEYPPFTPGTFEGVCQIINEVVSNVIRHADATHLDIVLRERENRFEAVITDDGKGFDPEHARRVHDALFLEFDVILSPAAHGEAPMGLQATGDPLHSRAWTLLHAPLVAVPAGVGPNGLPLAVQLVGPTGGDDVLLRAARWIAARLDPGLRVAG